MKKDDLKCEICIQAKSKKNIYATVVKTDPYKPGECLHTDLVYATVTSHRGNEYFLLMKDEKSNFRQVYLQKTKEAVETVKNIKEAVNFISNQTGNSVKILRSDNGLEYKNEELTDFLAEKGIQFGTNAPYTSESNGLVEREVRTEQESASYALPNPTLSENHWDDAIRTAVYLLNRTLHSKN
jgi:transposase InsO family protein